MNLIETVLNLVRELRLTSEQADLFLKQRDEARKLVYELFTRFEPDGRSEERLYNDAKQKLIEWKMLSHAMDWKAAEEHLEQTELAYRKLLGTPGVITEFATLHIYRLRVRFNRGERTADLYTAIMGLK